jgi:transcriptional regulator with XRE-family HTH domain
MRAIHIDHQAETSPVRLARSEQDQRQGGTPLATRSCDRCGTRLAQDNTASCCSACLRYTALLPPSVSPEFWQVERMRQALATWHMGKVIYAYRTHPSHGRVLSQGEVANWLGLTQAQLSRIENGKAPDALSKLIHYAQVLGIPDDLLWFKVPDRQREPVDRREFMAASAGVAAMAVSPALTFLDSLHRAPLPAEVRLEDIAQIRSAAQLFTGWDHTYGGGVVREAVTAQLRWSAELLQVRCPSRLQIDLFAAVGYLSGVCGFMAFDAYAHDDAHRMFTFGLSCAEQSGDWHLRAKLLSHMARQAIWCDDPDTGLTHTELALVRADRLTGTERAMLHTARARALGKLNRTQETLTAVGRADEAFAESRPSEDPPWMAYYDRAQHYGDTGHALFDLAVRGVPKVDAAARLAEAVRGHSDAYARSRAISGTKLATLLMVTDDPYEASAIGQGALRDAGHLRSRRAVDDLRELHQASDEHAGISEVIDLRDHITQVVGQT